jgi:outer membrane lipoprotein LolB
VKNTCLLILLAFLVACSEVPVRPDRGIDLDLQNQREQIQSWKLNGRLSITSEKESGTVTFHWSQDDEAYLMSFNAPLGQGTFALRGGEEDGVYLLTAENNILHADNAETILQQTVGWHVPVSGFRYWVRGLQEPGIDMINQQVDDQGRITEMQQADWNISIKRYMDVDGLDLPGKIFMHNDHVKLKLIIQTWDTNP